MRPNPHAYLVIFTAEIHNGKHCTVLNASTNILVSLCPEMPVYSFLFFKSEFNVMMLRIKK